MGTVEAQGDFWSGAPQDWVEIQEPLFAPLYQTVLKQTGIRSGRRVLDVGCGAGLFCRLAADRGAEVAGIDAAEGMIAVARSRVHGVDFRVGGMEELVFADGSFDIVTGFNSFQFAADPINALRQARRVAKRSGVVAMAVWGRKEDCEAAAFLGAQASVLLPPPPTGSGGPFALSAPGALEGMLASAGLTATTFGEVETPFVFKDAAAAFRAAAASGIGVRAVRHAGADALRTSLLPAIEPFRLSDGSYRMQNVFRYVLAE